MGPATGLFVASTALSVLSQKKARKENRAAERTRQKRADLQTHRERIKQVRLARIKRAEATAQASGGEGTGGSGLIGFNQNITSQLSSNLSFLDQNQQLSASISNSNIRAAGATTTANIFSSVANVSAAAGDIFKE